MCIHFKMCKVLDTGELRWTTSIECVRDGAFLATCATDDLHELVHFSSSIV